jgi:hypothetical protein
MIGSIGSSDCRLERKRKHLQGRDLRRPSIFIGLRHPPAL